MKISMRDKKILLMFLGLVVFALGYFFGYKPQMEEADALQAQSAPLQDRLNELLKMSENREFYISETEKLNQEISDYTAQFPADIREEDGIVFTNNLENTVENMSVSNLGITSREFVASLDGSTEDDLLEMPDQTLSEQANSQTQEQIDEIEGTDVQEQKELASAREDALKNAADTNSIPVLFRCQDALQFTGNYQSLKDTLDYIASQSGRMTLNDANISYDTSTGNLTGLLTVNMFFMAGTGNTYTEPDAGSVAYGVNNLFGTIEGGGKSSGNDGQTDTDNNGSTDETQNADGTDNAGTENGTEGQDAEQTSTENTEGGENSQS